MTAERQVGKCWAERVEHGGLSGSKWPPRSSRCPRLSRHCAISKPPFPSAQSSDEKRLEGK